MKHISEIIANDPKYKNLVQNEKETFSLDTETGQASVLIALDDGNITVKHGTEDNGTPLLYKQNVKKGSWDKIWETLRAIETNEN